MDDLIRKLSEIRSEYNCFDKDEESYYWALSEAIRILSRRMDGDTISRQDAISELNKYVSKDHCITDFDATSVLLDMPSVQPDSKPGYWIVKEGETAFWDVCSKCGKKTIHRMPHFKYCPYCGKRMEV